MNNGTTSEQLTLWREERPVNLSALPENAADCATFAGSSCIPIWETNTKEKGIQTLYLSGAISNNPNYKRDFEKAHKALSDAGYDVISPLRICRDDWDWKGRLRQCIKAVVLGSDAIALIPTPFHSLRMEVEVYIAKNLDMPVKTVEDWIKKGK